MGSSHEGGAGPGCIYTLRTLPAGGADSPDSWEAEADRAQGAAGDLEQRETAATSGRAGGGTAPEEPKAASSHPKHLNDEGAPTWKLRVNVRDVSGGVVAMIRVPIGPQTTCGDLKLEIDRRLQGWAESREPAEVAELAFRETTGYPEKRDCFDAPQDTVEDALERSPSCSQVHAWLASPAAEDPICSRYVASREAEAGGEKPLGKAIGGEKPGLMKTPQIARSAVEDAIYSASGNGSGVPSEQKRRKRTEATEAASSAEPLSGKPAAADAEKLPSSSSPNTPPASPTQEIDEPETKEKPEKAEKPKQAMSAMSHNYRLAGDAGDVDRDEVDRLLAERMQAKRNQLYDVTDELKNELRKSHCVFIDDKNRTWKVNQIETLPTIDVDEHSKEGQVSQPEAESTTEAPAPVQVAESRTAKKAKQRVKAEAAKVLAEPEQQPEQQLLASSMLTRDQMLKQMFKKYVRGSPAAGDEDGFLDAGSYRNFLMGIGVWDHIGRHNDDDWEFEWSDECIMCAAGVKLPACTRGEVASLAMLLEADPAVGVSFSTFSDVLDSRYCTHDGLGSQAEAVGIVEAAHLHQAARLGDLTVIESLLCNGLVSPDVRHTDAFQERRTTALTQAARKGQAQACKLIMDNGADIDIQDEHRDGGRHDTALMAAVTCGRGDIVAMLLKKGVNISIARDGDGFTAFHLACEQGFVGIAEQLLLSAAAGKITCFTTAEDWDGNTGRDLAMDEMERLDEWDEEMLHLPQNVCPRM